MPGTGCALNKGGATNVAAARAAAQRRHRRAAAAAGREGGAAAAHAEAAAAASGRDARREVAVLGGAQALQDVHGVNGLPVLCGCSARTAAGPGLQPAHARHIASPSFQPALTHMFPVCAGEDFILSQRSGVEEELFKGDILGVDADVRGGHDMEAGLEAGGSGCAGQERPLAEVGGRACMAVTLT